MLNPSNFGVFCDLTTRVTLRKQADSNSSTPVERCWGLSGSSTAKRALSTLACCTGGQQSTQHRSRSSLFLVDIVNKRFIWNPPPGSMIRSRFTQHFETFFECKSSVEKCQAVPQADFTTCQQLHALSGAPKILHTSRLGDFGHAPTSLASERRAPQELPLKRTQSQVDPGGKTPEHQNQSTQNPLSSDDILNCDCHPNSAGLIVFIPTAT